jgi:replication factor C subunit 1
MEELAERVHGDIRMALNHLQYMSLSQSVVKYDDIRQRLNSSSKDEDISPFTAVDKYFPFSSISSTSNISIDFLYNLIFAP